MSDFELQAFVTNLGKYNEGELVGEWVSFPVTPEEMRAVLDRIGIGHPDDFGVPYEEIFITRALISSIIWLPGLKSLVPMNWKSTRLYWTVRISRKAVLTV